MSTDRKPPDVGSRPDSLARRQRSLSRDLLLGLAMMVSLVSLLASLGNYLYLSRQAEHIYGQKVNQYLNYLRDAFELPLWDVDDELVRKIGNSFAENPEVGLLRIADDQGRIIYEKNQPGSGGLINAETLILHHGDKVGVLQLGLTPHLYQQMRGQLLLVGIVNMLLVIMGLFLAGRFLLLHFLALPLAALIERTENLAAGNYQAQEEDFRYQEFEAISNGLNRMAEQVAGREESLREKNRRLSIEVAERERAQHALQDYRDNLENLASLRTGELEKANAELAGARDAAEAANRAKSSFLANMSHELRTPLNAILGFSEMIGREHGTPASIQEKVAIINRSGDHLLAMINDILDLSKIEAGRVELEPEAFDLPRLLEDIGRMFELRAGSAGLRFVLEIDPELARTIKADAGKLRQILINLLGNAVKFTQEGGFSLRARTRPMADDPAMIDLQLEVQDSGPGIVAEQLQRIFQPFVQADLSSSTAKDTGLGLAISKSFVELMGGEIGVESKPGKGALFQVNLPVALAEDAEAAGVETSHPMVLGLEPGQPSWRILVVEDNAENRILLTSLLVQVGLEVREALDGERAVNQFEQWQPHFIWMDMRMPVMDGYQATARIRELPGGNEVKIVALTASAFKEQRQKILEAGCDEVVHKPYQAHEIFDAMAEQLGVHYQYAEAVKEPGSGPVALSAEAVTALPKEVRDRLREAALSLSNEEFDAALAAVRARDPALAEGLAGLAREFRFDRILELIEKAGRSDETV